MNQPSDDRTAYGRDKDGEPSSTAAPSEGWSDSVNLNPDDFGPETQDGDEVNPDTGKQYGEIEDRPA